MPLKFKMCIRLFIVVCLPMSFASTYTHAQEPCVPGTFSESGNAPCEQAPRGQYVPTSGATSALVAKPGFYVPTKGATEPTKADPGFFVDQEGATFQTPASIGTYVPEAGASMAILAEPGFYVDQEGATSQTPAGPGTYVPEAGAIRPILAAPGFFVAESRQSSQTPAPAGTFVSMSGANSAQPCPQDSMSFGSAPACRAGFISASNPSTIGPQFNSDFGTNGPIDFGILEVGTPASLSFTAMNTSSDLGMGNLLTDLTLNRVDFLGRDAALFSSSDFVSGTLLRELDSFIFNVDVMPTSAQTVRAIMAISTDQYAAPGEAGQAFFINLTGVIRSANSVSAPASISLFLGVTVLILLRLKH